MFVSVFTIVSHAAAYYHIYLHSIGGFKNILTENIGRSRMGMSGEIPPDSDNSEWGEKPPTLNRSGEIGFQTLLFWLLLSLFKHC